MRADRIEIVRKAMIAHGCLTDRDLAELIGVATATANAFRSGRNVSTNNFKEFCHELDLDWMEIAELIPSSDSGPDLRKDKDFSKDFSKGLSQDLPIDLPTGVLPIDSPVYVQRSEEVNWYVEITKPGALIRICAPRMFGKSSLVQRILEHGKQLGHRTVYLSLRSLTEVDVVDTKTFFGWFYSSVARELGLQAQIRFYAETLNLEFVGSTNACLDCFADHLLANVQPPLTLCIDKLDYLLMQPTVARDFFAMLRVMNEKTKMNPIWQHFRLILVYANESIQSLVPLTINQSPFNVGTMVRPLEFTPEQVKKLAGCYRLDWTMAEVNKLMALVGGLPFWVHLSLYYLESQKVTLEELLEQGAACWIYQQNLHYMGLSQEQHPALVEAMKTISTAARPIEVEPSLQRQLHSLGLVHSSHEPTWPRCRFFRDCFQN